MTWKRWLCLAGVLVAGGSWGQPVAQAASQRPTQDNLENARIINYWIKANDIGGGGYKTRLYKTVLTHRPENSAVPQLTELINGFGKFAYDQNQTIQGEVTDVVYTSRRLVDEKIIFEDIDDNNHQVGSKIVYDGVSNATGSWPVLPVPKGYQLVNPEDAHRLLMDSSETWHIKVRRIDKALHVHQVPQLPSENVTVVTPPATSTETPGSSPQGASKPKPPVEAPHADKQPGTTTPQPVPPASTLPGPQPGPSQSSGAHGGQPTDPKPMPDGPADKAPQPGQSSAGKPDSDGPQPSTQRPLPAPKDPQPQPGPVVVGPTQPQGQPGKQPATERPTRPAQPDGVPEKPIKPTQPVEPTPDRPQVPQHPETPQLTPPQSQQSLHQGQPVPQPQKKPTGPGATAPAGSHPHGSGREPSTPVPGQSSSVSQSHRVPVNLVPVKPHPLEPMAVDNDRHPALAGTRPATHPHSALQEALATPSTPLVTGTEPQPRSEQFNHVAEPDDADNQISKKSRHAAHRHPRAHQHHTPATKARVTAKAKTPTRRQTSRLPQTAGQTNRWAGLGWLLLGTTLTSPWVYRRLH